MQIHFYFKKNSDLHLMEMQILDVDKLLTWGKFGSTSKEDADPFFI